MISDLITLLVGKITKRFPKATLLLALTATAPKHLKQDLDEIVDTQFHEIKTKMDRSNISLSHLNFDNDKEKTGG